MPVLGLVLSIKNRLVPSHHWRRAMSESNMNVVRWCLVQGDPAKMQYDENGEWVSHQVYKGLEERWEELKADQTLFVEQRQNLVEFEDRIATLDKNNERLRLQVNAVLTESAAKDERITEQTADHVRKKYYGACTCRFDDDGNAATVCNHHKAMAEEIERLKAREKLILTPDLTILADANLQAKSTLENDKYASMVKNAHDILEEANDTALNWMSDPRDG